MSAPDVRPYRPRKERIFLWGSFYALVGLFIARALTRPETPEFVGIFAVALAALGILEVLKVMFAWHRDVSWSAGADADTASRGLAVDLLSVEAGVILGFGIWAAYLPDEILGQFAFQLRGKIPMRMGNPGDPFTSALPTYAAEGIALLAVSLILAGLFKEGGLAFVFAWVGSLWGIVIAHVGLNLRDFSPVSALLILLALALASVAYAMAGMTGLFLGRGAQSLGLSTPAFHRVARSCAWMFLAAFFAILFASAVTAANVVG